MSKRIEAILDVVHEIRERFQNEPGELSIKNLRIAALYSVADVRGIQSTSVSNKFRRELLPDIRGTAAFDRLLDAWLVNGSDELENILRQHASDSGDLERIETIFTSTLESDLLLAQEFGYEPKDEAFMEGRVRFRLHLRRERSAALVALAKARWNREHGGQPRCSICEFSFAQTYGEDVGGDFIQAHHIEPMSTLEPDTPRTPDHLAPVCSNCHSMLHHRRPWRTVEEMRNIVKRQRDGGTASHA